MYPLLRRGDRLSTVAVVQTMLNRALRQGTHIDVDGNFGGQTRQALISYQVENDIHWDTQGVVGPYTWRSLIRGQNLQVLEAVDITERSDRRLYTTDFSLVGSRPIYSHGMSDGVRSVVHRILHQGRKGRVVLLRFHGHGSSSHMVLSAGTTGDMDSMFSLDFIDSLVGFVRVLSPLFCRLGSVELHGCNVGSGAAGRQLVRRLCGAWNVPVTAGIRTQFGGGESTFAFEGPVVTDCPGGVSLMNWSRSIPGAGLMSVAR